MVVNHLDHIPVLMPLENSPASGSERRPCGRSSSGFRMREVRGGSTSPMAGTRWSVIPSRAATLTTAWTESTTTVAVGCASRSALTSLESCTAGTVPRQAIANRLLAEINIAPDSPTSRSTSLPIPHIPSSATTASSPGIHLSCWRWNSQACRSPGMDPDNLAK